MNENENAEMSVMDQTLNECKILYCQKDLPMTKTCMCWLWECGKGWHNELRKMSCRLEALNLLYYDKYKVRIQMDQVKEKFGYLTCYYSVVCDNYTHEGLKYKELIDDFESKVDNGYFGIKHVVDEKGYTSDEVDENGNTKSIWHPPKSHIEVTQHKEEYDELSEKSKEWYDAMLKNGRYELTPEQNVIIEMMDFEADKIINEATTACHSICEDCGSYIGSKYHPRCQTTGWITYICDKCAEKAFDDGRTRTYYKNGALYDGKTLLKTKEQVDAENEAYNKKINEKYGDKLDYGNEEDEG